MSDLYWLTGMTSNTSNIFFTKLSVNRFSVENQVVTDMKNYKFLNPFIDDQLTSQTVPKVYNAKETQVIRFIGLSKKRHTISPLKYSV